jgi:GNAT superfamily N-acetyltransferase
VIRQALPEDLPGVHELLAQMPGWGNPLLYGFKDENLVATDHRGQIIGWLNGNHVSQAWCGVLGYDMPEDWLCSYVTWLLVDEEHRSVGIGRRLMEAFARDSAAAGRDTVVASPQSGDDELALLRFYARRGYRRAESGQVHRGPHGPQDDVPLPVQEKWVESSTPDPESEAAINEYMRKFGYKG